ncbi:GGDEF domain-containing protein, partial [Salmonella enterica subsp. enterica serovar Oranienburg]|nr:GGDEF domain-containing protein [Salmonella enterica]ECC9711472.1 GGDEF domain-containing protein [Salmonella enterica subsp. enterica]EDS7230304.1 GGDEF domain-containing protein [Salmonella enterica subsp. enterica serovar Oranienburg]EDV5236880.1 GGDEF domain-containing protein [Salmonella enterica subsp. enterica serovar Oranienburg]
MGQDSDDRRRTSSAGRVWQDHKDMVRQALRVSIPWFTFVNISFALIILFRHILISDFDKSISAQTGILPLIDDIMGSIIVFSFLILLFIYRLPTRFT